jgi:hypothetical protein
LGERIWQQREAYDIPRVFSVQTHVLNLTQVVGLVPFIWGMYTLNFWMTMTGMAVAFLAKTWFFDRMVFLFEDRRHRADVQAWLEHA